MKDFLLAYWKELAYGFVAVMTLLLTLFRKKGKTNPAVEHVYSQLPSIISHIESVYGAGHGDVKKAAVLDVCDSLFYKLSGIHLKSSEYFMAKFDKAIEDILSTPSRKEKNEK